MRKVNLYNSKYQKCVKFNLAQSVSKKYFCTVVRKVDSHALFLVPKVPLLRIDAESTKIKQLVFKPLFLLVFNFVTLSTESRIVRLYD